MTDKKIPRLFGIKNSNRDFTQKDSWGKNQFNSSFPAALACYLYSKNLKAVYYETNQRMEIEKNFIGIDELFGVNPLGEKIFFSFETQYTPFQKYIFGSIPRNDLVILVNGQCVSTFEIKLVALPDNSTCDLEEKFFGVEIVVRPDTIIYLACSFIKIFENNLQELKNIFSSVGNSVEDWEVAEKVLPFSYEIYSTIKNLVKISYKNQIPMIIEPVWKTLGKSPRLAENCLDVFVWSNCGILNLFMPKETDFVGDKKILPKISRHTRTMIWLFKMLKDFCDFGKFDGKKIIDKLSFNTKNDKAFSSNGLRTQNLMNCEELKNPRITKNEIKNIILGGGQNLLSPERRFDAIIYNSPELFAEENL